MEAQEARRRQMVEVVRGAVARATGRVYRIALDTLDEQSLMELRRLLRDLEQDKQTAVNNARIYPWRR